MDLREATRLHQAGQGAEAEAACRRLLEANPADAGACHLLGRVLLAGGRLDEAAQWIGRAVALFPASVGYRMDLSTVLAMSGRPGDALPHLREALRVEPLVPELHNNLGGVLEALEQFDEAAAAYRAAIRLRPTYADAHYNLGNVLRKTGKPLEAVAAYQESLCLKPNYVKAANNLATVLTDLGELDAAIACFRNLVDSGAAPPEVHSSLLYALHYHPEDDPAKLFAEHREWSRRHEAPLRRFVRPHDNDRTPGRRLKVGYVSSDFREQTVTRFIGAALERHDRNEFDVFLYSGVTCPDTVTRRLQGFGHAWREVKRLTDDELDRLIRADGIDILVDLRGHGAEGRSTLFARKPAPMQICMVGWFDTTGLDAMSHRLTDEWMDPPGATEAWHTERLVRLPGGCWCYSPDNDAPDAARPPVLESGHITFGSLNKIVKVTPPCARLWRDVLDAVPRSRLTLVIPTGDVEVFIRRKLVETGLPGDRLDLLPQTARWKDYLSRFNQIDIALDTFPFNGITITCDGLWMGVPLVSLAGRTSVSRAGRSILHASGLPELATDTPESFIEKSIALATDVDHLSNLRLGLRKQLSNSPLLDHAGFTRRLESAYRRMWRNWCDGVEREADSMTDLSHI